MMDICQQKLAEAIRWHKANSKPNAEKLDSYRAGYMQGFREALATVRLHGYEGEEK